MKRGAVLLMAIAVLLVGACEDNTYINNRGSQIEVAGTLEIWQCDIGHGSSDSHLFDDQTDGDSARITFMRLNGMSYSFYTDSTSSFNKVLDEGPYTVFIETRWTRPDTISNVYLGGDTTIELHTVFWTLDPVHLTLNFWYPAGDTAGAQWEWDRVRALNSHLNNKLAISGYVPPPEMLAERRIWESWSGAISIDWPIPIRSPEYHIYDVFQEARLFVEVMTSDSIQFTAYPEGMYICPDK